LRANLSKLIQEQFKTPSPIRQIMKMAERQNIINLGLDPKELISFGGGWVNHFTPESYRKSYLEICDDKELFHNSGGYSATIGELECRRQICNFEKELFNVRLFEDNVIIGLGSTQLMHDLFITISDPGDSIMLLDPTYPNYFGQIKFTLRNSKTIFLEGLDKESWTFIPDLNKTIEDFQDLCQAHKPKIILLVSPDNPTGQIIPQELVEAIMDIIDGMNTFLIIDFAYKSQYFEEPPEYFSWSPSDHSQLIAMHSNSKWGRGLGRRLGWVEADETVIEGLESTQQCNILCPDTLHQMAFAKYVESSLRDNSLKKYIEESRIKYKKAAKATCEAIEEYLKMRTLRPQGGLYTVTDVRKDSDLFVTDVLKNTGVLLVPGKGFGPSLKNGVRISYGPLVENTEKITEGIKRIGNYLSH